MGFNLRQKLQQAKDAGTAALSIAVIAADSAADRALEKLGNLEKATVRKTGEIRATVGEKVDATKVAVMGATETVKEKTVTNLGKLGDAIEEKAGKVSVVAAEFGKNARSLLNLRKPAPAPVEVAPVVQEAVKKARKRTKKPAGKKAAR
jgi:hypothetical protein